MVDKLREFTGTLRMDITRKTAYGVQTSMEIEKECWVLLKYYFGVEDECINLISEKRKIKVNDKNISELKKTAKLAKAFFSQAENYYKSTQNLSWKSSPLPFYYCYMNLVKALMALYGDSRYKYHGLSVNTTNLNPGIEDKKVQISKSSLGIFPNLYTCVMGKEYPKPKDGKQRNISIKDLFGYAEDVTLQYLNIFKTNINRVNCILTLAVNKNNNSSWFILLVPSTFNLEGGFPFSNRFKKMFEEVQVGKDKKNELLNRIGKIFDYKAFQVVGYKVYQSKDFEKKSLEEMKEKIYTLFRDNIEDKCHESNGDLIINLPMKVDGKSFDVNEFLSIYMLTYYLSSIVRYSPDYLLNIEGSYEEYLYESFVKCSANNFLRYMLNMVGPRKVYMIRK